MFFEVILWIIFVGAAILLAAIILLQEAKGGGLAEAFGGMGAQTFGVKATGITKFTTYVAIVFILSAVLITVVSKDDSVISNFGNTPAESSDQPAGVGPGPGAQPGPGPAAPPVSNPPSGNSGGSNKGD